MSRNGSGVYSLPAAYQVANGDTILPVQHNTPLEDIETDLNAARPVVAGGTGATTESAARDNLEIDNKVLSKSANYTLAAGDRSKLIRGTSTMTLSLPTAATAGDGFFFFVMGDGAAVTIDPDSAETIDGAATLAVQDGDIVEVFCDGSAWYAKRTFGANATFADLTATGTTTLAGLTSSGITIEAAAPILNFSDTGGDPEAKIQYGGADIFTIGASNSYTQPGIDFGVGKIPTVPLQVAYTDASASTTAIIENEDTGSGAQVRVSLQRGSDSGTGLVKGGVFFVTSTSFGVVDYEARDINFLTGTSAGSASLRVRIPAEGGIRTEPTTVSGLPSASTVGAGTRHFVTDANATTFASVVAGGGSNGVPVYSDGTNWRIG